MCGEIDFFCLLCEESFQNVEDVEKHIRWEKHRKILKKMEYFPKFKKERVYKLQSKYYCEACNFIAIKFDAIKNHVKEESHTANKANPPNEIMISPVKRESNYVKIGNSMVTLNEWHGILGKEKQCMMCQMAVIDVDGHVTSSSHVVNLIQAKLKCEDVEQYYRELNNKTFYCFICKKIYTNDTLIDHWGSEEHAGNKPGDSDGKSIQYFDVDKENDLITCRICKKTMTFTFKAVYSHRSLHIDQGSSKAPQKSDEVEVLEEAFRLILFPDRGQMRHELKLFGQDNHIKMTPGGGKGYCTICVTYISSHMRNFKQHVQGARHQGFLEMQGLVKNTKRPEKHKYTIKPLLQYAKNFIHVKEIDAFWLNKEICVGVHSFMFLSPLEHDKNKMRCFLCDKTVPSNMVEHFRSVHQDDYLKTQVVTTFKDEFIREIRPRLYHCGYCNQIFPGWDILKKHFNSWKHKSSIMNAAHMLKFAVSKYFNCPLESIHIMNTMNVLD